MISKLLEIQAREKIGQSDEWHVFRFEVIDSPVSREHDWVEVEGAITPLLMSGKRKGKANWAKRDRSTQ